MTNCDLFNSKLINEVKNYEAIYNNAHPDHRRKATTHNAWTEIANILEETVEVCRTRWSSLRQKYGQEFLRISTQNHKTDWKYFDEMEFMKGFIDPNQNFLERVSKVSKRGMFCRTCLRKVVDDSDLYAASYNIFSTTNFVDKLNQCTNLKSLPWDNYPHSVCAKCFEKVLDFHRFQMMCRESLEKFNAMMENTEAKALCVNNETNVSENTTHDLEEYTEIDSVLEQDIFAEESKMEDDEENSRTDDQIKLEIYAEETSCLDPLAQYSIAEVVAKDEDEKFQALPQIRPEEQIEKTEIVSNRTKVNNEHKSSEQEKGSQMECEDEGDESKSIASGDDYVGSDGNFSDEESISDYSESSDVKEKSRSKASLKCEICAQTFRFQHRLEAHQRKHQGLPGYPCTYANCHRGFNRLDELRHHLNEHNGISSVFKCQFENCNMIYTCSSGLNKHKRMHHKHGKEIKKYTCETCGKVLTSPRSLQGHRFIHVDKAQWPFVCDEDGCERKFRLKSQLRIHKKRHAGIKNYICPHCGVRKTTCTELKIHINFHTFEEKFPCAICSKVFKSVGVMRTHVNRVHEGKKPQSANNSEFTCSICDRKFSTLQSKKYHEMTHTGEKPLACEECGKRFIYPSGLKSHMNMHMNDNPYSCQECGRGFKWPTALKSHMKLHLEEGNPYSCEECGKGFRWPGSYYRHKKMHAIQSTENVSSVNVKEDQIDDILGRKCEILHNSTTQLESSLKISE